MTIQQNSTNMMFLIYSVLITFFTSNIRSVTAASYEDVKAFQESILTPSKYSTSIRPVQDQNEALEIFVSFSLVSIVAVDDVNQELVTNAFLYFTWIDQRNNWDPVNNGITRLMPDAKDVWRPRIQVINAVKDRDPFKDDHSTTFFESDGEIRWTPSAIFHTFCPLNMKKFPFDVQNCKIQILPVSHTNLTIKFDLADNINMAFYSPNSGWEILETRIAIVNINVVGSEVYSCPTFYFKLKRHSTTIVLNIILPVVVMSLLNNFVFLIPAESGEKISYSITVLLSLSVFMSTVSTITPQLSDTVPALTIYLFVLLLLSVFTVLAVIFSVFLDYEIEEREEVSTLSRSESKHSTTKVFTIRKTVSPNTNDFLSNRSMDVSKQVNVAPRRSSVTPTSTQDNLKCNKYKRLIAKHINKVSFVTMNVLWVIMTTWYFTSTR